MKVTKPAYQSNESDRAISFVINSKISLYKNGMCVRSVITNQKKNSILMTLRIKHQNQIEQQNPDRLSGEEE